MTKKTTLLLFAVLAAALAAACAPSRAESAASEVVVIVSGDSRGEYAPCGCKNNPAGGLAKRAFVIEQQRAAHPDAIYVDLGNQFHEHPRYGEAEVPVEQAREDLFVDVMNRVKATAAVPGALEFALGPAAFQRALERSEFPFLAGNLVDESTGKSVGPETLVVNAGGHRVGLWGVVSPDIAFRGFKLDHSGFKVTDPADFAKRAVQALDGRADIIIGLVHVTEAELREIAKKADGTSVILAGNNVGLFSRDVRTESGIPVLQVPPRGKDVGVLRMVPVDGKFEFVNRSEREAVRRRLDYFTAEKRKIEKEAGGGDIEKALADKPADRARWRTYSQKVEDNEKALADMEGDRSFFEFTTFNLGQDVESDMTVLGWMTRFSDKFGLGNIPGGH